MISYIFQIFAWNLIGAIVVTAWCFVLVLIVLLVVLLIGKLRVKRDIEHEGSCTFILRI